MRGLFELFIRVAAALNTCIHPTNKLHQEV